MNLKMRQLFFVEQETIFLNKLLYLKQPRLFLYYYLSRKALA
jgi:hypothetical protein